jgi:hypothetical protein
VNLGLLYEIEMITLILLISLEGNLVGGLSFMMTVEREVEVLVVLVVVLVDEPLPPPAALVLKRLLMMMGPAEVRVEFGPVTGSLRDGALMRGNVWNF